MADREKLIGRRAVLRDKEYNIRVAIDTIVKNVIDLFSPTDQAMKYVDNIDIKRLRIQVADIERKSRELQPILTEIKNLNSELGDENGH